MGYLRGSMAFIAVFNGVIVGTISLATFWEPGIPFGHLISAIGAASGVGCFVAAFAVIDR